MGQVPTEYCELLRKEEILEMEFDEKCKPISHSPLSLLELASMKTALNILLIEFNEIYPARNNFPIKITDFKMNSENLIQAEYKVFKKTIDIWLYSVARQLEYWVEYFIQVSNDTISYQHIYSRLHLISFGGHGIVNLKDSISNFLKDDSLNYITKFKIACQHCLEQDVDFLWPQIKDILPIEGPQFDNEFMSLYYWISRKRGESSQIPLQGFNCIERLMIDKCCQKNLGSAVEYFFNLLDPHDQLVESHLLFEQDGGGKWARYLLSNLSSSLQCHILKNYNTDILYAFVVNYEPVKYVIQCWLYIKNFITIENYFHNVIEKLLKFRRNFQNMEGIFTYNYIEIILVKIWSNSPPNFKSVVKSRFSKILVELESCGRALPGSNPGIGILDRVENRSFPLQGFGRNISFLLAILPETDINFRNRFWIMNWSKWIENVPPSQFEELIRLCVMKTEAIEHFKTSLPKTQVFLRYYDKLMRQRCYNEIDEFLNVLYSNDDRIFEIKKNLSTQGIKFFLNERVNVDEYLNYIHYMFPNGIQFSHFTDQLLLSDEIFNHLCDKIVHTGFEEIDFVVSLLSSNKQVEFKNKIMDFIKESIMNDRLYPFDGSHWRKILMLCLNNDQQRYDDFLKSLPIHGIFERRFTEIWNRARYNYVNILNPYVNRDLKKFLMWYFESNETYEKFIRGKIEYYGAVDETDIKRVFGFRKEFVIENLEKLFL